MERKTISVHAITVHIYTIAIVVLVLLLLAVGAKYVHLKWSVERYTSSTIWMNQQPKPSGQISDYAIIIAQASTQIPADSLQTYVSSVSRSLDRDIVIIDKSGKIIADTLPGNRGTVYGYDSNGVIKEVLSDGKPRVFEEKSIDYPDGILETVVVAKDSSGQISGVVLVSNSQINP